MTLEAPTAAPRAVATPVPSKARVETGPRPISSGAPSPRRNLNAAQEAAVKTNGHCLVTACPGSGKTFVLRERAIRKLKENPGIVGIAVTFTRDAARELEARVLDAYPEGGHRLRVGTFHSLCKQQLEEAGITVNLVNEVKQAELMQRAWRDIMRGQKGITLEQARLYVDSIKSSMKTVTANPAVDVRAAIYFRYQELLRQLEAMDFADMLVETSKGMLDNRVPKLPGTFMLVDEAQDSDAAQLGWVDAYMRRGVEITVVGDDDQSIYSWRFGSGYSGMERFREASHATHITLDTTYRCAKEILMPAGRLIERNRERMPKRLRTENPERGQIRQVKGLNREDEIERLVSAIMESGRPGDWGVLVRTNKLARQIEQQIGTRLTINRSGGKSFWDLRWPSTMLGLLGSICFDDMVGVDGVLRMAGVSERRLTQLHREFQSRNTGSLSKFLASAAGGASDGEVHFRQMATAWRNLVRRGNVKLVVKGVCDYMIRLPLLVDPGTRGGDTVRLTAMNHLAAGAKVIENMRSTLSLAQRLRNLQNTQDEKNSDEAAAAVRLMTFHGSKGLEFENVWMLGCEDGVIPAKSAPEDEERRLFYVGMTRAKRLLVISHSEKPPSPFINECGALS